MKLNKTKKETLMSNKNFAFFLVILFAAFPAFAYELNYYQNQFSFYSDRGFDRISAPGFRFDLPPGAPELPVKYLHFIIPPEQEAKLVNLLNVFLVQIPGSYYLYPTQPSVPLCSIPPWIPPDTSIYNSDSLYPGKPVAIVNSSVFDGARIVTVAVYPLQYRPLSRRLFISTSILFDFQFRPAPPPRMATYRTFSGQKVYDNFIKATVYNTEQIPLYYRKPIIVPDGGFKPQDQGGTAPFIIITSSELFEYFLELRNWLREKGRWATITTTDWIYNRYSGRDNAERIRNYLIHAYLNMDPAPVWVLLGGDDGVIPVRYGCGKDNPPSQWNRYVIPSDLYFSDLNGNWHVDNDDWWGEPTQDSVDVFPELFVGRVTVKTQREIEIWTNKLLHYEKEARDSTQWFVTLPRAFWTWTTHPPLYLHPWLTGAPQEFPDYFIHDTLWEPDADVLLDTLNYGHGYVHFYCHGGPDRLMTRRRETWSTLLNYCPNPPNPGVAGLNWLRNKGRYYPVYAISCYCAAYDNFQPHGEGDPTDTTIMDAFVDNYRVDTLTGWYPIGASAFLGNTRSGWWTGSGSLHREFCEALFEEGLTSLGTAEGKSKVDLRAHYLWHSHNLFGSPENEPWFKEPGPMFVTHPETIPCGQEVLFEVVVHSQPFVPSPPIPDCRVCPYKPGDVYEVGYTDRNGRVEFLVYANTPGEMKVTCVYPRRSPTYPDYLPSQTICYVVSRDEKKAGVPQNLPAKLSVSLASPNPVIKSKSIRLRYAVPQYDKVTISLYTASGSKVTTLLEQKLAPGYYETNWETPAHLPTGAYWVLLTTNKEKKALKLLLIR